MKKTVVRVGNIFCIEIDESYKVYFQFIVRDYEILGSEVIRVFRKRWPMDSNPTTKEIISDDVGFYTHVFIHAGLYENVWYKIGTIREVGIESYTKILFGRASATKVISPYETLDVNPLENWWIGHINEPYNNVGVLPDQLRDFVEVASVMPYDEIIDRVKRGYFMSTMAEYKVLPRRPWPDAKSYVRIPKDDKTVYLEFLGETPLREVVEKDGQFIGLTPEYPESDGERFARDKFTDYGFMYQNFITSEEFEEFWRKTQIVREI